ncbi:HoxF-like protein [Candidatus Syntrophocurvum alkaliphilum]|uniref:HoxF-like protein n=1 Tax=Candidatus Syntrophocurvum alkaliphilum TaxID=2293317 RepID=A0A6I6DDG2_9FIRM|nr:NADH-ubiquinone oxidoreductase-F iron-sulfur binding region domain-containing protein [Candidatus Syntrophocurvum alkaliphilum]QGT99100.1 HoxF-like protein [Candidatus Syntrophocurvum alkaliphilum]
MAEEMRVLLKYADQINPESADDYIKVGGYKGLEKARSMDRKALIEEVKSANLRGRGGAGFNAGLKWSFVPEAEVKYVVCNLDEGEPGTYKDRIICQKNAQALLEGMAICGAAIGSNIGYIYCRGEYPFIVELLNKAIENAKASGALGEFNIEVRMGAGAYVCGEETALIESLEGNRGEARFKPPFPGVEGAWGAPTVVNNVETLAYLPYILTNGAEWFRNLGAENYPGTKIITLTGDIEYASYFEVPTNYTLRDVIYKLGGGIKNGKKFKAVQVGGTSGAFIPESQLDTPIDFDSMSSIGAALGSGAVLVLDETRDIVDVVTRIAKFFEHESCGKCNPCREGTFRQYEIMKQINSGKGTEKDLEKFLRLSKVMQNAALCGLGQAAPVPIESTIKHFEHEYRRKLTI